MKVIGQDTICTDLQHMGLGLSGNGWAETMCDEGDQNPVVRCRVSYNRLVDDRSQRPVLSPLRSCVDRCHVRPYWASGCKSWRWMLKDISKHGPIWFEACCQLPLYNVQKEMQHWWVLAAMRQ